MVRVLDKVKVICEWPAPKNVHEVRQCLANYYRRYRLMNFKDLTLIFIIGEEGKLLFPMYSLDDQIMLQV